MPTRRFRCSPGPSSPAASRARAWAS
jgi:hypothetical protein